MQYLDQAFSSFLTTELQLEPFYSLLDFLQTTSNSQCY